MHKPRKLALAVLASITIAGIAGASASSLGGLTGNSLGSDDEVVASCDSNGINITYTTAYNSSTGKNDVTAVNFAGVDPSCTGKTATVTLRTGTASVSTGTSAAITVSPGFTFSLPVTPYDAELVNAVSLVIQG